ncbi:GNAT family N-acetyltransferase [Caballeronia sp. LZ034LL]|uniref:GNAT family N-acetyltransferase n=1 Tax=Caballeronia sp. LZ034LL TaxID=3038567 RepID=UPI002855530B|nr:GNAT family N-acetyltransferase [Caballeronia sp. LZ034LL]MDR5836423.1 GNAT family N-acetyltransferase [Caballeronia sp. LZ034LL]
MNSTSEDGGTHPDGFTRKADRKLSIETCRDLETFRKLRDEWNDLSQRAQGRYFQSFEYCHGSLLAEHAGTARTLHCVVARRDGRLVAVWPLLTSTRRCWTFAEPLAPRNQSPSDILVAPESDADAIVRAVWEHAARTSRADVFELWRIRKSSPLHACLKQHAMMRREVDEVTPFAALREERDWVAYCRSRPARERNAPEYLKRRLAKHGAFAIDMIEPTDARLPALIEWFVAQKRKWAEEKASDSQWTFSAASQRFWHALLTTDAGAHTGFRLFVLTLDGQPIAANILAIDSDAVSLVANTYDLAHRKLSPGTVLVDECVHWAFERQLDFDFGPGEQRYKTSWSAGAAYASASFVVLATRWGHAGYMSKQAIKQTRDLVMHGAERLTRRRNFSERLPRVGSTTIDPCTSR